MFLQREESSYLRTTKLIPLVQLSTEDELMSGHVTRQHFFRSLIEIDSQSSLVVFSRLHTLTLRNEKYFFPNF